MPVPNNVNHVFGDGLTRLMIACTFGKLDRVKELLKRGAAPNKTTPQGDTALHMVHVTDNNSGAKIVKLLVAHGANINAKNKIGETPLHVATRIGSRPFVKALLDNGADIDGRTSNTVDPPIFSFVWMGDLANVKYMRRRGASVNVKTKGVTKKKWTLLQIAILKRHAKIIKYLVGQGASTSQLSYNEQIVALHSGVRAIDLGYKAPLHNRFNTLDPLSMNHVALENAVTILGEHVQNGKVTVRHVYDKNFMNQWMRNGVHPMRASGVYRSPGFSGKQFPRHYLVPLANVLSMNDKKRYRDRYRKANRT